MSRGDYRGDAITITPKAWPAPADQALWATEDDYRSWNGEREPSSDASNHEQQPPTKKPRGGGAAASTSAAASRSKAIGKMFYKTKLCCKFRAGTCPYITNCNFAHGIEELRKPPPNWQEILAAQEDGPEIPREEHRIPIISSGAGGEAQRSYKGRHCKKFYTDEGCPYGDTCTFLHDEQSRSRESLAISLGPTGGSNGYGGGVGGGGGGGGGSGGGGYNQKLSNWKTRICNKWEMTGYCPFESKCQFAHGAAELHRFGGGLVDGEGRDSSSTPSDPRQAGILSRPPVDSTAYSSSVPHTDSYNMGISSQRGSSGGGGGSLRQVERERPLPRWKGPQKISRVYGDWIDDHE